MLYVTLDDLKAYLWITSTTDDKILTMALDWSSRLLEWWKGRRFDVRLATRVYDAPIRQISSVGRFGVFDYLGPGAAAEPRDLRIKDAPLLEVVTLTNGDGTVIDEADYRLYPANMAVKSAIRILDATWQPDNNGHRDQAIQVYGYWGVHDQYERAWAPSGDALKANISGSSSSLTVTDADGTSGDGRTPRFQVGQLLRLTPAAPSTSSVVELVEVETVISGSTNVLGVWRGMNGTSAVSWATNDIIEIWRPAGIVEQVVMRLAAWRYRQKDVDNWDRTYVVGTGVVTVPTAMPADVYTILGARGKASI